MAKPITSSIIPLQLADKSYDIVVERGLASRLAEALSPWYKGQQCVLITQQAILDLYAPLIEQLKTDGIVLQVIVVAGDESAKNISEAEKVWTQMVQMGCDRSSILLALGGGVVGDLGGFVAATYMRGIAFIQIPTTLLAMIDSAIGGKTAVNLPAGKNLVGAIYQPKTVLIDPDFLQTLPQRNVISSLAEAVKYGLIRDPGMFEIFEKRFNDLVSLNDTGLIDQVIAQSCAIKAQIVANDERESGERRLLNYGHTIGHAFETIRSYQGLYHGEAIIYGMKCANFISHKKGLLETAQYNRAQAVLNRFALPALGEIRPQQVLDVVAHDKKMINGQLNFILLNAIGEAVVNTSVSVNEISDSLQVVR